MTVSIVTKEPQNKERVQSLRQLEVGVTFRDAQYTYDEAKTEGLFWRTLPKREGSELISAVSLDGVELRKFCGDFKVIEHAIEIAILRNV